MYARVLCTLVIIEHYAVVKCMWYSDVYVLLCKSSDIKDKKKNDIMHKLQKVKTVYIDPNKIAKHTDKVSKDIHRLLHAWEWGVLGCTTLR